MADYAIAPNDSPEQLLSEYSKFLLATPRYLHGKYRRPVPFIDQCIELELYYYRLVRLLCFIIAIASVVRHLSA